MDVILKALQCLIQQVDITISKNQALQNNTTYSVSNQLIGRKSNLIFLLVKLPYRRHSSLNTMSR